MTDHAAVSAAHFAASDHGRYWHNLTCVYPVYSRRAAGLSIGVNLNPDCACNFDCVYCQVDRAAAAHAARPVDMDRLDRELNTVIDLVESGAIWQDQRFTGVDLPHRRWVDIAFSGDGEPTACMQFPEAVRRVDRVRCHRGHGRVRLVLLTNATLLHRPAVVAALACFTGSDQVWAKLDACDELTYSAINRSAVPLERVKSNILALAQSRPVVIQTMFCRLRGVGPTEAMLDAYAAGLAAMRRDGANIPTVQVYTIARQPAESFVDPLSEAELAAIAERLRGALMGVAVETYGGVG